MEWDGFYRPYVSVRERRRQAQKVLDRLKKSGRTISPVLIEGRKITRTFWGSAWCQNLESYSDYANRLPRGRTYVRNGSVMDLQISEGSVSALVCGHELYEVEIGIKPLKPKTWKTIRAECAGKIDSLIELLQGKLSRAVMEIMTRRDTGLFPAPSEISLQCSCPDWAGMCKHVAASLYGVGARLDEQPELLFALRKVDHVELIGQAPSAKAIGKTAARPGRKVLNPGELSDIFGIDIAPQNLPEGRQGRKRKPK
jgi:uncharacterized Zn finger protein